MADIETTTIGGAQGLTVPRIINGLWQLADGHGAPVDTETAAAAAQAYLAAGFGAFDCADRECPGEEGRGKGRGIGGRSALERARYAAQECGTGGR
jgi:predicted oxidoreductase